MEFSQIVNWENLLKNNSIDTEKEYKIKSTDLRRQLKTSEYFIYKFFTQNCEVQLLADEVGMGKTYIALALIAWFINSNPERKCLLITPQSVTLQKKWQQEIVEFNKRYLTATAIEMKPVVINDFGSFLKCAGDYKNCNIIRIRDEGYRILFLKELWNWSRGNNIPKGHWNTWLEHSGINEENYLWYNLYNHVSANALNNFFSAIEPPFSSTIGKYLIDVIRAGNCESELNSWIRKFLNKQESYEPNVVIIKMNQLSPGRSDSYLSRELSTFIVRSFLKRRNMVSKTNVIRNLIRWENNFLIPMNYFGEDRQRITNMFIQQILEIGDYANVGQIIERSENYEKWLKIWNNNLYPQILNNKCHEEIKKFIRNTVAPEIISNKIKDAEIDLCIVDEVHNWKSGRTNGASMFKSTYSPVIPKKLLMSATPFQIHPPELNTILEVVCSNKSNSSYKTKEKLFTREKLFENTIQHSRRFNESWKELDDEDIRLLKRISALDDSASDKINTLLTQHKVSPELNSFLNLAIEYKEQISCLEKELSKIMTRHSRDKGYRNYHSGYYFNPDRTQSANQNQSRIYETKGYTSKQEAQALFEFIAMRFDQLSRTGKDRQANAHLLGGMTSSFSAFIESQDKKNEKLKNLSEEAVKYKDLIYRIARKQSQIQHSKVQLTRSRVLSNWNYGYKTLIFCYRTATVAELCEAIEKDIEKEIKHQCNRFGFLEKWEDQAPLKREFLFKDDRLWRSFLYALAEKQNVNQKNLDLYQKTRKYLGSKAFRIDYSKLIRRNDLHKEAVKRAMRIIDLLCLRNYSSSFCKFLGVNDSFLEPLFEKAEDFLKYGYVGFADANYKQLIKEVETEDELAIDNSKTQGVSLKELLESEPSKIRRDHENYLKRYIEEPGIWFPSKRTPLCSKIHGLWWALIKSELQNSNNIDMFFKLRKLTILGLRKMILRKDLIARYLKNIRLKDENTNDIREYLNEIAERFYSKEVLGQTSIATRISDFLEVLNSISGTINPDEKNPSKRQALWNGIYLKSNSGGNIASPYIKKLDGSVNPASRSTICQAFNSPLLPDILVCTCIGQEGIDLHQYCSDVIHHDLAWNPALLEQRTGRIDRLNSLTERERRGDDGEHFLEIGIPFLGNNYDQYQYDVLVERAQCFEILMGDSVIKQDLEEYHENIAIDELDDQSKLSNSEERMIRKERVILPNWLVDYLKLNLSIGAGHDN